MNINVIFIKIIKVDGVDVIIIKEIRRIISVSKIRKISNKEKLNSK